MRRIVMASAFFCVVWADTRGQTPFWVPYSPTGGDRQKLAGVPVSVEWNTATSPPTIVNLQPVPLNVRPVVLSRTGSPEEVAASAAEFIDAHPEWFRVSSKNLDFRPYKHEGAKEGPRGPGGWHVNSNQFHRGIPLYGGSAQLAALADDGSLLSWRARLFPEADLEGLSTETAVSVERAIEIGMTSQEYVAPLLRRGPDKVVAFRGLVPFIAWQLDVEEGPPGLGLWLILIDGQTGEVLEMLDEIDYESPAFVRGDANGDTTIDIADPVAILSALFLGETALSCPDAADGNDDGSVDVTDGIYDLSYLFLGGPPPAAPFPNPGQDRTPDSMMCR